jgi:hypothetical protein
MSHLRGRDHAVLTVVLGIFVLLQGSQAQPQQKADSTPTSTGQGSPANWQSSVSVSDPFSVVTSKGTWTNQTGSTTVPASPLEIPFSELLSYGYDHFLPKFAWKAVGGIIIDSGGYIFDARSFGCEYAGEPGACVTVMSPDGHVLYPGDSGAPTICPQCPPYQEPGSRPILLNVPTLSDSPGPVDSGSLIYQEPGSGPILLNVPTPINSSGSLDSGAPNSSGITVIESQLVSDSPPPANGITIETPQFVANPSPDGIEAYAPSAPISIVGTLLADGPSVPVPPTSGSHKTSFWENFANGVSDFVQSDEFGQVMQSFSQNIEQQRQLANAQNSASARGTQPTCKADESAMNAAKTPGAYLTAVGEWAKQMRACENAVNVTSKKKK